MGELRAESALRQLASSACQRGRHSAWAKQWAVKEGPSGGGRNESREWLKELEQWIEGFISDCVGYPGPSDD